MNLIRTDSSNPDFLALVKLLDAELTILDGDQHDYYHLFNQVQGIKNVVVVYQNNEPCGCGAFKPFADNEVEIKRMFVSPEHRNKGIAAAVLKELEDWAIALKFDGCVLETSCKLPGAIQLYKKWGYEMIPNYGQYKGVEFSVCMRKKL